MHYGIKFLPAEKGIFWIANEQWCLHYACKAYDRGNYCKYIIRLAKKLGLTEGEFSQKFHLSHSSLEDAIQEAKFSHNVSLSLKKQGHPDYTDDEWNIELKNRVNEIRKKYNF